VGGVKARGGKSSKNARKRFWITLLSGL